MQEVYGDLWTTPADARCVTTNSVRTRKHGVTTAIMGGGCALEAAERYPELPRALAEVLDNYGNHVALFTYGDDHLVTFPTKHHYKDPSDLMLIARSCDELIVVLDEHPIFQTVLLPRPGVGLGGLDYATQVRPILVEHLDDRVHVITWESAHAQSAL